MVQADRGESGYGDVRYRMGKPTKNTVPTRRISTTTLPLLLLLRLLLLLLLRLPLLLRLLLLLLRLLRLLLRLPRLTEAHTYLGTPYRYLIGWHARLCRRHHLATNSWRLSGSSG